MKTFALPEIVAFALSNKKEKARDFARFLAAEKNRDVWKKHGYLPPKKNRPHPALTEETTIDVEN